MKSVLVRISGITLFFCFIWGCGKSSPPGAEGGKPSPEPVEPLDPAFAGLLVFPEDETEREEAIERGHDTFYTYGCWHCHTIGDEEAPGMRDEIAMGPDMADVGSRLTKKEILRSILDPNAVIAEPVEKHTEDGISRMPELSDPSAKDDIKDIVIFLHHSKLPSASKTQVVDVTEENFEREVDNADHLVLLDFWAEWCFPCLELSPVLEEMAPLYQGQIKFCKIDVDENPVLVDEFVPDLMFPCLVMMKDGKVLDRKYGADPDMDPRMFFENWFAEFLPAPALEPVLSN